ncbi:MAG: hypothetical protein FWF24_00660 [Alphaproteobacteria bacterium]|nr:hypothetical protein [Alphaproteobacteria bacterium]
MRNIQATITAYEQKAGKEKIPNASLIYGVGAAILFALSLYHFLMGGWAVGLLVFLIASALLGFSFYYMRLI